MPNYLVRSRHLKDLGPGEPFRLPGMAVVMRVKHSLPAQEFGVVETSLREEDAEAVLELMQHRGEIVTFSKEPPEWVMRANAKLDELYNIVAETHTEARVLDAVSDTIGDVKRLIAEH